MAKNFFSGLFGRKKDDPPPDDRRPEEPAPEEIAEETPPETARDDIDAVDDLNAVDDLAEDGASNDVDADAVDIGGAVEAPAQSNVAPIPAPTSDVDREPRPQSAPPTEVPPADKAQDVEASPAEKPKRGWLSRLRDGLKRTSDRLSDGVTAIFTKRKLDDEAIEELEDLLISADLGVAVANDVTTRLAKDRFDKEVTDAEVRAALADVVADILAPLERPLDIDPARKPHVVLVAGVNGAGKTTTIGKLAARHIAEGRSVRLVAGDTFRAAAVEQLAAWGERVGAPVVSGAEGADAAGLAFDALKAAQAEETDLLLIDTAGRLQNKRELMDELAKIVRVLRKLEPDAPHDTLLVLDATVGQNALSQAAAFKEIADVTGLVMTKLDGTARGGVLVALAEKFRLPIHYVGVGEGVDDLQRFEAAAFARALADVDGPSQAADTRLG